MTASPERVPVLTEIKRFTEEVLLPHAARLDRDALALRDAYLEFERRGLTAFGSSQMPLSSAGMFESLALLSEGSGAFAFLALQQYVGNLSMPDEGQAPWPRLGVAFGHLRHPTASVPVWKDGYVNGIVPWITGAGILNRLLFGFRLEDGREAYAWIDTADRPEFRHSPPMDLIACTSTRTHRVEVRGLKLEESEFLRVEAPGSLARGDAMGVIYQTPLMIGNLRASLRLIESSSVGEERKRKCRKAVEAAIAKLFEALETGTDAVRGPDLRARIGDLSVRLSRLAAMACGGKSLTEGHPAQRLYREALVFSLMAQTPAIVEDAFEAVFG